MRSLKIALEFIKIRLNRRLVFRSSAILGFLTALVSASIDIFAILGAIYSRVDSILGWNKAEMIVLQGVMFLLLVLYRIVPQNGLFSLSYLIEMGYLDTFLVRPISLKLTILLLEPDLTSLPRILVGVAMILYGLMLKGFVVGSEVVVFFTLSLALSFVILVEMEMLIYSLSFWIYRLYALYGMFDDIAEFGKFPAEIYGKWLKMIFLTLLPIAVISNFPARILLGKGEPSGLILIQILLALVFAILVNMAWRAGIKRYESVGT